MRWLRPVFAASSLACRALQNRVAAGPPCPGGLYRLLGQNQGSGACTGTCNLVEPPSPSDCLSISSFTNHLSLLVMDHSLDRLRASQPALALLRFALHRSREFTGPRLVGSTVLLVQETF
jgi:hypothetical protein